jgi:hypothetical protein
MIFHGSDSRFFSNVISTRFEDKNRNDLSVSGKMSPLLKLIPCSLGVPPIFKTLSRPTSCLNGCTENIYGYNEHVLP